MTAEKRGMEMMYMRIMDLPIGAYDLVKHISKDVGYCGEVCLTAYCIYAQVVEGLKCTDVAYHMDSFPDYREWLKDYIEKETVA